MKAFQLTSRIPGTRRWLEALGIVILAYLLYAGVADFWQANDSYGPPKAERIDLIMAPGVSVAILPSAKLIADTRFDAFDVSPSGAIVVSVGSRVVDMNSGEDLFTGGQRVRSFAFVGDALAVIDADGKLGFYNNGRVQVAGASPILGARLLASSDRSRLFFLREGRDNGRGTPALVSMREGLPPESLTGSFSAITMVGGDSLQTYFSDKDALFQIITPGHPSLLFLLPDPAQSITGIAVAGTALYFATERAVYVLEEGIAVPLVIGLGGDIRIVGSALYVLESNHGRVYEIAISKSGKP